MALALDGKNVTNGSGAASYTISLTTTKANDVIIIGVSSDTGFATGVSSANVTWDASARKTLNGGTGCKVTTWKGVATAALTNETVTVSFGQNNFVCIIAFGVSGADTTTVWDSHAGIPATDTTGNPPGTNISLTTSNANDFIFAMGGDTQSVAQAAGAGFTLIEDNTASQDGYAQYEIVSATQSAINTPFSASQGGNVGVIADAIIQASAAAQTTFAQPTPVEVPLTAYLSETPYA